MQESEFFSIGDEFSDVSFGDRRLDKRLIKLASAISACPGESFPEAVESVSALEATYRFLGNPRVTPEAILTPHITATVKRACLSPRVVIAHDTTTFTFRGNSMREGLGWLTSDNRKHRGRQGFLA